MKFYYILKNCKPLCQAGLYAFISVVLMFAAAQDSVASPREYQLKAVFLNGFVKFVSWPPYAFNADKTSFNICVMGENPFGKALNLVIANSNKKRKNLRPLSITHINVVEQAVGCHIVYISDSEIKRRTALLDYLKNFPILTVSDMNGFVKAGGMIQFYNKNNKVRFMIDPRNFQDTGLEAHGNLLRVADVVK